MKNGEILEQGDIDKIYQEPQNEYTKLLLETASLAD